MKHGYLLLLFGFLAINFAAGQNDELHIPLENDNQFPPDEHVEPEENPIEGSGEGVVGEPVETTTELQPKIKIEDIKPSVLSEEETLTTFNSDLSTTPITDACPKPCVCNIEGDTNNFVVDCSGFGLTEFPSPIDTKTTTLNLQNNKLTEIPKQVSALKNLKVLNVNNNEIMELAPGSISELPELITLKLANNRLIEYPRDLKNSLIVTKLQELDLGGNDMRTKLSPDAFLQFKALRKLTLPNSTPELLEELCATFKDHLETVCTDSCESKLYDCPDTPQNIEEGLIDATLPGMIAFNIGVEDIDPSVGDDKSLTTEKSQEDPKSTKPPEVETSKNPEKTQSPGEFSLRTALNKEPAEKVVLNSIVAKPIEENKTPTNEDEIKIGAKTTDAKTGQVDKSIIGVIVAGMVIVVAVITIKKNWSSISKRFGSSSRPPNNRTAATTNGTTAEEVPLQDKSPV